MIGRIDEAWPQIKKVFRTRTGRAGNPMSSSSRPQRSGVSTKSADITTIVSLGTSKSQRDVALSASSPGQHYIDAPSRILWDALVDMLVDIVACTSTSDLIFDDIVEMLAPIITSREDVREALEARNADAVWLALFRLEMVMSTEAEKLRPTGAKNVVEVVQSMIPKDNSRWRWAGLR